MMHKISLMTLIHCPCRIFSNHVSMTAWFISDMTWHNNIWLGIKWRACSPTSPRRWRIILLFISWWSITCRCSSPGYLNLLSHIMLMIIVGLWWLLMLLASSNSSIWIITVLYLLWLYFLNILLLLLLPSSVTMPWDHLSVEFTWKTRSTSYRLFETFASVGICACSTTT